MAYADFTMDVLKERFGLTTERRPLFPGAGAVPPPGWLQAVLQLGEDPALASEKSRSEFIVAPILLACRQILNNAFVIYSGVRLDVDDARGLKGQCDFILARSSTALVLESPLMVIVEAKKHDIEEGITQCAAEMIGVRLFNEKHHENISPLFGCVTNGETWQLLQLADNRLVIDTNRYFINEVEKILGILTAIMTTPPSQRASDAA